MLPPAVVPPDVATDAPDLDEPRDSNTAEAPSAIVADHGESPRALRHILQDARREL